MPDAASETPPAALRAPHREALERFILSWGEMASSWGINRTMAQIHALLYASEEPFDTDAIMARLQVSRGNANMNLRSLMLWGLVRKVHLAGSRKDFYAAEKDVWEITAQIIREREKREIQPVVQGLEDSRRLLVGEGGTCEGLPDAERIFCERIDNMLGFMRMFDGFSSSITPLLHRRNAPLIQQLVQLAQHLTPPEAEQGA